MEKYHIERNTVQETLIIPLYGRKVCSEKFPELFSDPESERIINMLDYDFSAKSKKMYSTAGLYGALEVAQRQYDLMCEVRDHLKEHPGAAVVNLGCGLDATFRQLDNGSCRGYNLDFPDVIKIRNDLLPAGDREKNIPCDLNDTSWFDEIDGTNGAVFFAAGVFYYFRTEDAIRLFDKMAEHFPGGVLVFDACNKRGVKLMLKTWIKEADIKDVGAYFAVKDAEKELLQKSSHFAEVSHKSYMRGYRNIDKSVRPLYRLLNTMCDRLINMQIVKIRFR
ncbi:MAG: class I SAM-dependent methyltransferase [Clostridia bacterium]|nr:class I SAM-dependent methyltransferase [Clostridia bacterium]